MVAICRRVGSCFACYTTRMDCQGIVASRFYRWLLPLLALATACEGEQEIQWQPLEIASSATLGGKKAQCGLSYTQASGLRGGFELADARLYLSEIELYRIESGRWEPLQLDESPWQHAGVVLLDYENARGACESFGSQRTNEKILGRLPKGSYGGLRFTVGIPAAQNHIDPVSATGPLAETGMFWTWQGGYKFLKVDLSMEDGSRYNVHLGSTGCRSAAPMIAPDAPCARPNRSRITLFPFDPYREALELQLDSLLVSTPHSSKERSPGCMGSLEEAAHCEVLMPRLGLDPSSGSCEQECAQQQLFHARPIP